MLSSIPSGTEFPLSIQRVGMEGQQIWRRDSPCDYPHRGNEEGTLLGSDEGGTEWKYHCYKSIHRYQNQILNRNDKGNVTKEREKLAQGLTKLTIDTPRSEQ